MALWFSLSLPFAATGRPSLAYILDGLCRPLSAAAGTVRVPYFYGYIQLIATSAGRISDTFPFLSAVSSIQVERRGIAEN